jgi:4-hydroxybenzoate polyprenyltransferase
MGQQSGTTNEDYRWRWLATTWALGYGFGYPAWMAAVAASPIEYPPGTLQGAFVTAWLATVVYVIGPENIKAVKEMKK